MEAATFVSKARTAFSFAATKVEQVLLIDQGEGHGKQSHNNLTRQPEIESPLNDNEPKLCSELKHIKWRPPHLGIKKELQDKIKNIRIGRKEVGDKVGDANMTIPFYDENLYILNMKNDLEAKNPRLKATKDPISPSSMLKQLAIAID